MSTTRAVSSAEAEATVRAKKIGSAENTEFMTIFLSGDLGYCPVFCNLFLAFFS
jgi:hypothetical protein